MPATLNDARETALETWLTDDRQRLRVSGNGPDSEWRLAALSPERHCLLVNLPTLCADSRSLEILLHELAAFYAGPGTNGFDEDPLQYSDFAEWQHDLLESEETRAGRDFWRKQSFAKVPAPVFPGQTGTFSPGQFRAQNVAKFLPAERVSALLHACGFAKERLPDLLLTCWQVLLARITSAEEFVIGRFFDGRRYKKLQGGLGLFGRYLPLHCRVPLEVPFLDLLRTTALQMEECGRWQETFHWEPVTDSTGQARVADCFHFLFDWSPFVPPFQAGQLSLSFQRRQVTVEPVLLGLHVWEGSSGLELVLEHDETSVPGVVAARLLERLEALLESVCQEPLTAVGRAALLGAGEREAGAGWLQPHQPGLRAGRRDGARPVLGAGAALPRAAGTGV